MINQLIQIHSLISYSYLVPIKHPDDDFATADRHEVGNLSVGPRFQPDISSERNGKENFSTFLSVFCGPLLLLNFLIRGPGFWPFHSARIRRVGVQCNKISIRRSECPPLFKFSGNWHLMFDLFLCLS